MAHRIRESDTLPIDSVLPAVVESLAANQTVVLQAPPGSGKTTRVAPALLGGRWLRGRKILMLEPRRLAARRAAIYMAQQRDEPVGATVGYQVRLERVVGPDTRIEILTEGLLVQRLLPRHGVTRLDTVCVSRKGSDGKYPETLRRVTAVVDVDGKDMEMTFNANNFAWSSRTVAELYRARWAIEIFFNLKRTV